VIDPPTVPVLPAASAPSRPPRYLTVTADPEPGRPPLRRIVRADGFPLCYVPPPKPASAPGPLPEAMGLRLFDAGDLRALRAKAARQRKIVPPPVRPDDAPAFTPDEIGAIVAAAGLSQRDAGEQMGCSRGTVAGWIEGRRVPQPDGARALAALLLRAVEAGA
jgi:DNA-binding transcriptional regulator YiaG